MARKTIIDCTVAEAYLTLLAERGIEYFFGNAGTDFVPLIEAFAKAQALGRPAPVPVTVAHENATVAMAMGYTMATGRPQAVMLHTNVGTANGICQFLNANRLNLPMLFTAGRTPIDEDDVPGGRSIDIHWTQEMYDQAGMVREAAKWDYELRNAAQLETVVDRALNIAKALPGGPVYLTLPREVLAAAMAEFTYEAPSGHADATAAHADADAIERLADMVAAADDPVIVTTQLGNIPAAVDALAGLARRFAVPVTQSRPRTMNLACDHPMHLGYDPGPWVGRADLVIAIECEVPWIPRHEGPPEGCKVVHMGADPTFHASPVRGYRCDLAVTAAADAALTALAEALTERLPGARQRIERRRTRIAEARRHQRETWRQMLATVSTQRPIHPAWASHCLDRAIGAEAIVMREAPLDLRFFERRLPRTLFGGASGLGWGLGGAAGAKLACPERLIVATEGDGAYMYANPVASHQAAAALGLPFLTVILNNQSWNAVRQSTVAMYPGGFAARANRAPLTDLEPSPHFERVVTASDGYGERVDRPEDLPAALDRALDAVTADKRQAVLNIICGPG